MKRIAILAIVVVGLVALAVAVLPDFVSTDLLKRRIGAQISGWTGWAVMLNGDASLSIYPRLAVGIDEVTIANPQGMGDDPFITAERLTVGVRLLPLIVGRIDFDAFELTKPRIHLVVDKAGRANWWPANGSAGDTDDDAAPGATGGEARIAPDIRLGRLTVSDGTIVFDNLASGRHEEMIALTVDVAWPSAAAAISGSGALQWRGETIEFNGSAAAPLELAAGRASAVRFAVASTPLRIAFNGKLLSLDDRQLAGEATVATPSMRRTIEWLGTPMGPGAILGAASIKGTVDWSGPTISFADARFELDGNSGEGALAADFSGDRPTVRGTLAFDTLDLSPYLEAIRADLIADGPWLAAPTRLPIADRINADLRVSTGEILVGATRVGAAAATATIKDGQVTIDIGEAELYGGTLEARISAAMVGETLAVTAHVKIAEAPVKAGLTNLADIAVLGGTGAASLEIGSRGQNWGAFAQSTTGTATVEVVDGSLSGLDIDQIAAMASDPLAQSVSAGTGSIDFSRLAGTVAISGGALETLDLVVTGDGFRIAVAGWGSVLSGVINGEATMARIDAAGLASEVPLRISGTWRAPLVALDPNRMERGEEGAHPDGAQPSAAPPG